MDKRGTSAMEDRRKMQRARTEGHCTSNKRCQRKRTASLEPKNRQNP